MADIVNDEVGDGVPEVEVLVDGDCEELCVGEWVELWVVDGVEL